MEIYGKEHNVNFNATKEEIDKHLDRLANSETVYDYNTVCDEIIDLLLDCFGYASSKQGITGFQAGCIDLGFVFISRNIEHGRLQDFGNLLYPQFAKNFPSYKQLLWQNRKWLKEEADKNLKDKVMAVPDVIAHWKMLSELSNKENKKEETN
jgi:hypothetical protein